MTGRLIDAERLVPGDVVDLTEDEYFCCELHEHYDGAGWEVFSVFVAPDNGVAVHFTYDGGRKGWIRAFPCGHSFLVTRPSAHPKQMSFDLEK